MIKIKFPDGTVKEYNEGITIKDIAADIGQRLAQDAVAAKVNGELVDLSKKVVEDGEVTILTGKDEEGLEVLRHSGAHLLAEAVVALFPDAQPTIGPVVENGFYYDFDMKEPLTPEDLEKIEQKMKEIAKQNLAIERVEFSKEEAKKEFKDNQYKLELIEEHEEPLTAYKQGEFVDLCRGPHVPSVGKVKAFKLTKIAGAYWRADAANRQLQRVYGVMFGSKDELKAYLKMLEEAKKRDHRKLGKELELFSFSEVAPGFPFFHAKGTHIFNKLQELWRDEHAKAGYVEIKTPLIMNRVLWEQSGHWGHYKENMYFTKIDEQDYAVKPMNCPGGILVFKDRLHSYRELPMRVGEMGLVHRHELSGVLAGLFRVRAFTQDDAHIFCTEEQIQEEVIGVINLIDKFYKLFGFEYHMELSTKPEKSLGSDEMWDTAESALKNAMESIGVEFVVNEGDGAFYGPKIDFHIKDAIGRTWQCATVQLDFAMPEKFDLTYEGADGQKHRPVMLHRVVYGSMERFIGILTEHYAGRFPLWLSPLQVRVCGIADRHNEFVSEVAEKLNDTGLLVDIDTKSLTVNKKVREAQLQQINYILIVGDKEMENKTVNVRTREGEVLGEKSVDEFVKEVMKQIKERA